MASKALRLQEDDMSPRWMVLQNPKRSLISDGCVTGASKSLASNGEEMEEFSIVQHDIARVTKNTPSNAAVISVLHFKKAILGFFSVWNCVETYNSIIL